MKTLTSDFIKSITDSLNTVCECYYEKAPKDAPLPYVVLSSFSVGDIGNSDLILFDLNVYQKENGTLVIETLSDTIRSHLNGLTIRVADKFSTHIYFENQDNIREQEFDLINRRLQFNARVFNL